MRLFLVSLGLTFILGASPVQGQEFGRIEELKSNVAYFYHARPGEATVQVSVWGTIPRPGIYEIPDSTDLDKIITMAGGVPIKSRQKAEERPEITIRLFRPKQGGRALLFEASMKKVVRGEVSYPTLQDGDILVVETVRSRSFTWRDALSLTSTALSIGLIVLRILALRQ